MSIKVGELFATLGLDDELSDDLVKVERRFKSTAKDMDAAATLGLDDSQLQSGTARAGGQLDDVTKPRTAKIDADTGPAVAEVRGAEGDISSAIDGWSDGAIGAAAGVGALAGKMLVDTAVGAVEDDKAGDKIAAGLNLGPEGDAQMRRVAERMHEALSVETVPEGMTAIGSVIGTMRELGDVSDVELERIATGAQAVADAFDQDINDVTLAASTMFENGLVPSYEAGIDVMAAALSNVAPAMQGDLMAIFTEGEYLQFFESIGYSSEEMLSGLVKAAEDGTFALDKVPDAMAEFQKLLLDDVTPEAQAAFNAMGLSAYDFRTTILAGGPDAKAAFGEILTEMDKLDEAGQKKAAKGLFGTPGEDIGVDKLMEGLLPNQADLGQVEGRAQAIGERLSDQVNAGWEKAYRANQNDMKRGWDRFFGDPGASLGALVEEFEGNLQNVAGKAGHYFDTVEDAFGEIPGWLGGAWEHVEGFLGEIPGWLGGIWEQVEDGIGRVPEAVGLAFEGLEAVTVEPIKAAWNGVAGAWNQVKFPEMGPWEMALWDGGPSQTVGPFGGWDLPDLPTFHSGGDVQAAAPGGEVFAKLLDGERVLNPSEANDYRRGGQGGGWSGNLIVQGHVMTERQLVQVVEKGLRSSGRARK